MSEWHDRDGERYLKWIPVVVPLLAVSMLVLVYIIDTAVL
jgi:hypothetical protein